MEKPVRPGTAPSAHVVQVVVKDARASWRVRAVHFQQQGRLPAHCGTKGGTRALIKTLAA